MADEYIAKRAREGLAEVTLTKARWLLRLLAAKIGSRPICPNNGAGAPRCPPPGRRAGQAGNRQADAVVCRAGISLWARHRAVRTQYRRRSSGCPDHPDRHPQGGHSETGRRRIIAPRHRGLYRPTFHGAGIATRAARFRAARRAAPNVLTTDRADLHRRAGGPRLHCLRHLAVPHGGLDEGPGFLQQAGRRDPGCEGCGRLRQGAAGARAQLKRKRARTVVVRALSQITRF